MRRLAGEVNELDATNGATGATNLTRYLKINPTLVDYVCVRTVCIMSRFANTSMTEFNEAQTYVSYTCFAVVRVWL